MADPTWKIYRYYDSLRFRIMDDGGWTHFKYTLRDANNKNIKTIEYSEETSYTFEGLEPDTYYIGVISWSDSTTGLGYFNESPLIKTHFIDSWGWGQSNGSATESATEAAREALRNNGATTDFSHKVWNDMVNKIQEINDYFSYEWDSFYLSYEDTIMDTRVTSDRILTANRFNSLVYNIALLLPAGDELRVSYVAQGQIVEGTFFINLARNINDCIDGANGEDWESDA